MTIRPRVKDEYELEPGYGSARGVLKRMESEGLVDYHKAEDRSRRFPNFPGLWTLKGNPAPSKWNWEHEIDCGDLMIAYRETDLLEGWDARWSREDFREFAAKIGLKYDRRMALKGVNQTIFFEIDKGNEAPKILIEKIEKYIKLNTQFPQHPFVVIFTLQPRLSSNISLRASNVITNVLEPFKRGKQFLVAPHILLVKDPLGKLLVSPKDPSNAFSILDL